jgi:hypothetical protein
MPGVVQLDQVAGADGIDLDSIEQAPPPDDAGFESNLAAGGVLQKIGDRTGSTEGAAPGARVRVAFDQATFFIVFAAVVVAVEIAAVDGFGGHW